MTFEVDFNSSLERFKVIRNLEFLIEIPSGERPLIENQVNSTYEIKGNELKWIINELSEEKSTASCEIKFSKGVDLDEIFPMLVGMKQDKTFFDFEVKRVV